MKKVILILFLSALVAGCSSSSDDAQNPTTNFKLSIDGLQMYVDGTVIRKDGLFTVSIPNVGESGTADTSFNLKFVFTEEGKFLTGFLKFISFTSGSPEYNNFIYYPSNYIQVTTFTVNETKKTVKIKFAGKVYYDEKSINSDSREVVGELNLPYTDDGGDGPPPLVFNNVEQYCRANFNSTPWFARFENTYSSFTNEGEYKIETHFANSPNPGNFNFNSSSPDNYVRLSKFNTTTLTFDYYDVSGQVGYTYRELHGGTNYSFIGTFSFSAVNPNNPADVIQVTDGQFRSYQKF